MSSVPVFLRQARDGFLLDVHLSPSGKKNSITGLYGERLKVILNAPPVDGKANKALVSFIASVLNIPASRIELVKGTTSRQKTLAIRVDSLRDFEPLLELLEQK